MKLAPLPRDDVGRLVAALLGLTSVPDALVDTLMSHAEGNPLMDQALSHGPVWFMLAKLSLVSLSVLLLWRLRHRRFATVGLFSAATTYALICGYHLSNAHHVLIAVR